MTAPGSRSAQLAEQFEAAHDGFVQLVERLDDEVWGRTGANFPERVNDEDEQRPVGLIAHHVALSGPRIIGRIEAAAFDRPAPPPADFRSTNAAEAREYAGVSKDEVVRALRETGPDIARRIREIPEEGWDVVVETPVGPMSCQQRLERVLIGHIKMHQGSIEAVLKAR